jgi:hypothetical protein
MSRIQAQAGISASPGQLGPLSPEPTSRQVFAASVGVDDSASQLLRTLQAAGQALDVGVRFQTQQNEQVLRRKYESAASEIRRKSAELDNIDTTTDEFGTKANNLRTQISDLYAAYESSFKGTMLEEEWTSLGTSSVGRVSGAIQQHRERVTRAADSLTLLQTQNQIQTSALTIPKEQMEEWANAFDPNTADATMQEIQAYVFETLTDNQKDDAAKDNELGVRMQSIVQDAAGRILNTVVRDSEDKREQADRAIITENLRLAASSAIVNPFQPVADIALNAGFTEDDTEKLQDALYRTVLAVAANPESSPEQTGGALIRGEELLNSGLYSDNPQVIANLSNQTNTLRKNFVRGTMKNVVLPNWGKDSVDEITKNVNAARRHFMTSTELVMSASDIEAYSKQENKYDWLANNPNTASLVAEFERAWVAPYLEDNSPAKISESMNNTAKYMQNTGVKSNPTHSLSYRVYDSPSEAAELLYGQTQAFSGDPRTAFGQRTEEINQAAFNYLDDKKNGRDTTASEEMLRLAALDWEVIYLSPQQMYEIDKDWLANPDETFDRVWSRVSQMTGRQFLSYQKHVFSKDQASALALEEMQSSADIQAQINSGGNASGVYQDLLEKYEAAIGASVITKQDNALKDFTVKVGSKKIPLSFSAKNQMARISVDPSVEPDQANEIRSAKMMQRGFSLYNNNGQAEFIFDPLERTHINSGVDLEELNSELNISPSSLGAVARSITPLAGP